MQARRARALNRARAEMLEIRKGCIAGTPQHRGREETHFLDLPFAIAGSTRRKNC
jgi:hypothetical protein